MVGLIIPLYIYPDSIGSQAYQTIINIKKAHPNLPIIAVIDPTSIGAGTALDQNYATWIKNLQNAGVIVLGYVWTNYGARTGSAAKLDIDNYWNWYHTNGIFFDGMNNLSGGSSAYSNLTAYTKAKGMTMTVGNPGTTTLAEYVGSVDNMCIYETSGMPSTSVLAQATSIGSTKNFSYIAFGVATLPSTAIQNTAPYVSFLYVTNDSLANPYDTIPPYLSDEAALLDTGTIPPPAKTISSVTITYSDGTTTIIK
jgi:hypothetical protein